MAPAATAAGLAVALAMLLGGCPSTGKPPAKTPTRAARSPADSPEPGLPAPQAGGYRAIAERDLFRPLVSAPKAGGTGGSAAAAEGTSDGGAASAKGGDKPPSGPGRPPLSGPPDPTADLALTGIIETTDGLWALVEQLSTRKGEFVAAGQMAFGLTVETIRAGSVTLRQGPTTYELKLGAKQISGDAPAGPATSSPPSSPPSAGGAPPPSPPSGMPGFGGMSSDQRREAFRSWWDNMSEEDRQRFRERRGGPGGGRGGFGGGRGGPPGSRGGP